MALGLLTSLALTGLFGSAFTGPTVVSAPPPEANIQRAVLARVPHLRKWAADPVILDTLRRANAIVQSQRDIAEVDAEWQSTTGVNQLMRSLMTNACAKRLQALRLAVPEISEAFVTDRRGANVAMTNKTSDYWQGDEAKFTKAMPGSKDSYHIDPVRFDESIQAYAVQISLPVFDRGRAAGVLVVTLNLEKLERMR